MDHKPSIPSLISLHPAAQHLPRARMPAALISLYPPGKSVPGNGNALPPCPSGRQQPTPPPPAACPQGGHGAARAPSASCRGRNARNSIEIWGSPAEPELSLVGGEEQGESSPVPRAISLQGDLLRQRRMIQGVAFLPSPSLPYLRAVGWPRREVSDGKQRHGPRGGRGWGLQLTPSSPCVPKSSLGFGHAPTH